ncbi:hypothetical protein DLAC_10322 [Tieghemostelium lacteum]|uniref:Uncharacterized protein n=1 Tax=Tieghemostelium lacteum TaxID=361077 RepID=A0A151Z571_TIELA|nr:hypothetical protein DLAC_10322 [Tieghemostelium lacteum]|eukprot:KYQ89091.1 hypothetical protein DLAC_10322 [Tieghemostelium lacteum]
MDSFFIKPGSHSKSTQENKQINRENRSRTNNTGGKRTFGGQKPNGQKPNGIGKPKYNNKNNSNNNSYNKNGNGNGYKKSNFKSNGKRKLDEVDNDEDDEYYKDENLENGYEISEENVVGQSSDEESGENSYKKSKYNLSIVEEEETADEKKVRLAREYLKKISSARKDLDDDEITSVIRSDLDKQQGRFQVTHKDIISNLNFTQHNLTVLKGHQSPITCIVLSDDERICYSASKDFIIKWDLINKTKLHKIKAFIPSKKNKEKQETLDKKEKEDFKKTSYQGCILAMALSFDGKYLATGGDEKLLKIWDTETMQVVETFKGHKEVISALTFRKGTYTLYSGSHDRTLKIWDLSQMAFVDTRYGHQSPITSIDALSRERCVTAGTDKTCRIWKIPEESQLVFKSGHIDASIDCVKLVGEDKFLSGGQDGSVLLWNVNKKNPVSVIENAHPGSEMPWVTSVASIRNSDVIASGSCNGKIQLYALLNAEKLKVINSIPVDGFVNDMIFSQTGDFLLAAVAPEHKFGRWLRLKKSLNALVIINLKMDQSQHVDNTNIDDNDNNDDSDNDEDEDEDEDEIDI